MTVSCKLRLSASMNLLIVEKLHVLLICVTLSDDSYS